MLSALFLETFFTCNRRETNQHKKVKALCSTTVLYKKVTAKVNLGTAFYVFY
jgi:hypothetical protein